LRIILAGACRDETVATFLGTIGDMARRRRRKSRWPVRIAVAILAVLASSLLGALIGALVPLNADWQEPDRGITIYLADNGVHADLVLPASAQGLDWRPLLPRSDARNVPP